MVWTELRDAMGAALEAAGLSTPGRLERLDFAIPRDPSHGDWTTNFCMLVAKEAGLSPRAIAEAIVKHFPSDHPVIGAVEVAGAGFLNFRYRDSFTASLPARILADGEAFGRSGFGAGETIVVEFVSANPTGPMNIVSARAAAVGASLVAVLNAAGWKAASEFYVNDAGNQVDLLGASLRARFRARIGEDGTLPEGGYQGEYLALLAAELPEDEGRAALAADDAGWWRTQALERMIAWQQRDLAGYGVTFDRWFRESTLHESGAVEATRRALEARGVTYQSVKPLGVSEAAQQRVDSEAGASAGDEPATWLKTHDQGDDMDRVIVRADGRPTYLLPDIAYHRDKRERGFRRAINLWGPDHHAYVTTLTSALKALGLEDDFLKVQIVQYVKLMQGDEEVKMSKRLGQFETLADLVEEVGPDCARFFFLQLSSNAHLKFDMGKAKERSEKNPAFYVQYAHARCCSLARKGAERGLVAGTGDSAALTAPEEVALVRKLSTFPEVVRGAAAAREPHRVPTYLMELSAELHRYYHNCPVLKAEPEVARHRLRVHDAARQVLSNGLALMGVSAPERLDREEEAEA
ncbi:MAG: arginine--tRNA ligase [Candidatus Eisenbacteria bacterium]|nr:arginine--tRNA ligase [Candidatus Eisenbacteria bacterium]